jgi:N-acetylglucosamine-6-phosphate deacetylase
VSSRQLARSFSGCTWKGRISRRRNPGAHRLELIRHPKADEYDLLLTHAEVITQMTLAPELPGALGN